MTDEIRPKGSSGLPDFLRVSVLKGVLDERTAHRVELFRRTRGLGRYDSQSAFLNDPPDPNLTFDNLVVCKGNSFAVELAKTIAHKPPSRLPYNPLYIYGDVGLGKTHLLSAIANVVQDRRVLLLNVADLETEVERAVRLHTRGELRQWLCSAEILLVDDIQLCEGREDIQRDLFSVLNYMLRAHHWLVITSDLPPTRLAGVESRLLSRLGAGVIVSLQMGDRTERRDFIRHFLEDRSVPADIIEYLADNVTENIRQLKAAVAQLLAISEGTGSPMSIDMARAVVPSHEEHGSLRVEESRTFGQPRAGGEEQRRRTDETASRFKEMLAGADGKEEQALALQIALGTRIRQLRSEGSDPESLKRLEQALELLREGKMEEAIKCIST